MKIILFMLIIIAAYGQRSQNGLVNMPNGTTPPAACGVGDLFYKSDAAAGANLYGCTTTNNWTVQAGSGTPGTFANSTAVTSAFSATPTFSLANVSSKSPMRFEPGALTANVTAVTFTNVTAGAKFSIAWLQDGTGGRTVTYGASAANNCAVDSTLSITTTQMFEVAANGTTINGVGCVTNNTGFVLRGPEIAAPGTPAVSTGVLYFDSTSHTASYKANNSATPSTTVVTAATRTANQFVTHVPTTGIPAVAAIAAVDLGSGTPSSGNYLRGDLAWTAITAGPTIGQGTFAALPGTCTTGDAYFFTDSLYTSARCSATNTWSYFYDGRSVTPPNTTGGAWAWDNQTQTGSAVIDITKGYYSLVVPSTHTTGSACRYQTAPAAPYTKTFVVRASINALQNYIEYSVAFRATDGKIQKLFLIFSSGSSNTNFLFGVRNMTDSSTYSSDVYGPAIFVATPTMYLKLGDDNTNFTFSISQDGVTFWDVYTASRTAFLTPAQIAFCAGTSGAAAGAMLDVISIQ